MSGVCSGPQWYVYPVSIDDNDIFDEPQVSEVRIQS
jgi:hypothetical protein